MSLTKEERLEREKAISAMIAEGATIREMSDRLGLTKQAVWQFCAVRGWLPNEDEKHHKQRFAERNEKRRLRRIESRSKSADG